MIRKIKRSFRKLIMKNYPNGSLVTLGIPFFQAFELFNLASYNIAERIFKNFVITGVVIFIMAQISISSAPNKIDWINELPSYKHLKLILNSKVGMTVSACFGITSAFGYAVEALEGYGNEKFDLLATLVTEMVDTIGGNTKRIQPSKANWLLFARGESGAARGQFLSCPNTNLEKLNIKETDVINYDFINCLNNIGFEKKTFLKYGITPEIIKVEIRNLLLTDKTGMLMSFIRYNEPKTVYSKIQSEIFGDSIIRSNEISISLYERKY